MTSSLVGSEMCIRDRFILVYPWPLQSWQLITEEFLYNFESREANEAKDCLLYTSDAADDM
eukprot:7456269-Prorocentrum_lima.AAC.1